ncbi:MAG TPA: hypothetical protein VFZ72_16795 [Jiangellaceae bacterium]
MTTSNECTVVIRYQPGAPDGWPWAVSHDGGRKVLTITDLDDSSLGIILRALAQSARSATDPGAPAGRAELTTT